MPPKYNCSTNAASASVFLSFNLIRGLFFADRRCALKTEGSGLFADVIAIPGRNFHAHIAFYDCLATEARAQFEIRCHIQPVEFIIFRSGQILSALPHPNVARCASTYTAARVFQRHTDVERNI